MTNLWRIKFGTQIAKFSMSFSIIFEKCILILCIFLSIILQKLEIVRYITLSWIILKAV